MIQSLSFIPHPSSLIPKIRRALRGEVSARVVALEAIRRSRVKFERRRERARLERLDGQPARLRAEFARMSGAELLIHFRERTSPRFFAGFASTANTAAAQRKLFRDATTQLIESASRIAQEHRWPLLGYGEKCFDDEAQRINWQRDPLSGAEWPLDYHCDVSLARGDGSDARVLWELNRLGHLITLGRAYVVTGDESLSVEFFAQLAGWREQNPVGRGANWACAMEIALRAMNLLAAFELFLDAPQMNAATLPELLAMFDAHGAHIRRNLEFSYISTSNHYLSDVVGLLWLGLMLPELEAARAWREFGLREMLREMEHQVLPDGADCEASTGYHRFVLELFLYSFILCRANDIEIEERYWRKLRAMLEYVCAYLRPDGRAPLIGDTDSGQVMPITRRAADDHAYVLAIGATLFKESRLVTPDNHVSEELLWIFGEEGVRNYESLSSIHRKLSPEDERLASRYARLASSDASLGSKHGRLEPKHGGLEPKHENLEPKLAILEPKHEKLESKLAIIEPKQTSLGSMIASLTPTPDTVVGSQGFPDAGTYVMRQDDLYLLCNTSGAGLYGRGSHGHNDALSIEVSACGVNFIVDPGTYVYSANLHERHLFRSTAYHSTVEVDGAEQNTINEHVPFVIGDEAHPRVLGWETTSERDTLVAEHDGYARLALPVTHRRTVRFMKRERFWIVEDTLTGEGAHDLRFRFHFRSGLEVTARAERIVQAYDKINGATLLIAALSTNAEPTLEARFMSRDYGEKTPSISACWTISASVPSTFRWAIVPVGVDDNSDELLEVIRRLRQTSDV
jgi:hypothetical protein